MKNYGVNIMAGRPSKPTELILYEGNKDHRTKEDIEFRKEQEQALYTGIAFEEEKQVKENPTAHRVFLHLKKLFENIGFIDGLDQQAINRYCLISSEVEIIQDLINNMDDDIEKCEKPSERITLYKTIASAEKTLATNRRLLQSMEDRLYMNPATRMRAIPKKPSKEEEKSPMDKFLNKKRQGNDR
jgi:hypothetical protein